MALAASCNKHEVRMPDGYNDCIAINLSSAATKAEDLTHEAYLNHVDILIFDHNGSRPTDAVHYERITVQGAQSSVLTARRSSFTANKGYYVQVIANSTAAESAFEAISDYDDLMIMKQEDINVHLTALNLDVAPDYFLMDGVAYIGNRPASPGTVVINNGVAMNDTELDVALERAAAKIEIVITAGSEVNFADNLEGSNGASYNIRNLPYETFVIDSDPTTTTKLTVTSPTNNAYFVWNPANTPKQTSVIVYAYAHDWKDQSILEKKPSVIVNLPLVYTDPDTAVQSEFPNSWYKIPMSADDKFDRNKYYRVVINVNRPGAVQMTEPVELGPINYMVKDWNTVNLSVSDDNRPKYLSVNKNEMEMYNISVDNATIAFSSSSDVTVTASNAYYYDKFGARQTVSASGITATADGLSGNIVINSPLPTNNTVLYFTLIVRNRDGEEETINVRQYPLVYVENILSWYSYRDDFIGNGQTVPTTYENLSARNNVVGLSYSNGTYTPQTTGGIGFFQSKVNRETFPATDTESRRGRSDIDYYYWNNSTKQHGDLENVGNARMYHITIMASSGDYVLGKPKITNNVTDSGEDNSRLVSPSFMIASRLAVLTTNAISLMADWRETEERNKEYLSIYSQHCEKYVEVYEDASGNAVHLNDWRLPTAAELGIIYGLQGSANDDAPAIDYLLNAGYYYSASGPVSNPGSNSSGTSVRCVRDAF